jgi:hypothetical protein
MEPSGPTRTKDFLAGTLFVGREQELSALRGGLDEALVGHGRLLFLAGEPGIGKTRLASELATEAQRRSAQVLFGRCYEGEGAPPFWPWTQVVRAYAATCEPFLLLTEMGPGAADIAQVIPELRERLPELPAFVELEPEQARFRFFDSFTTFLKTAARRQPLLLILDDLHWADAPSLLLLQFLARELIDAALLVVGTYRDTDIGRQHPLTQALGTIVRAPGVHSLSLQGFNTHEVSHFLAHATGSPTPESLSVALHKETEGNPFFLNEVVRLFISEGYLSNLGEARPVVDFPVPHGVRAAIYRRLQGLSPACQQVLTLAAVIGREFSLDVLEAVRGNLDSSSTEPELLDLLEAALAAHVLNEIPQVVGRYSFSHALTRETLYEELSAARRVRLHGQIGEALENLYPNVRSSTAARSGRAPAELAYHFCAAARGGAGAEKALLYATQAGDQAMLMLAYEDAVLHYESALQALALMDEANTQQQCELLLALGEAQKKAGNSAQARETFARVAELARALGAQRGTQPAVTFLARAALGFGREWWDGGVVVDRRLIELLEEALAAFPKDDGPLRAQLIGRLAIALSFSPDVDRPVELSQQAVDIARRTGDAATLIYALSARQFVLWQPQHLEERLAMIAEILRIAEEAGDRERILWGQNYRIGHLLELGDVATAEVELESFSRLATELRHPRYLWAAVELRALWALFQGRFTEAESFSRQALALGQRVGSQTARLLFGAKHMLLHWSQGRLQDTPLSEWSKRTVTRHPAGKAAFVWLCSELGLETETRDAFDALAAQDFADIPRDLSWLLTLSYLARACVFLQDSAKAVRLYTLLLPYRRGNVLVPGATFFFGSVSHALGLLAGLLSRWDDGAQHFSDTLAVYEKMGARPWLAFAQYDYACLLLARNQPGDHEKVRELLELALAVAQALGMKGLEEKVESQKSKIKSQKSKVDDQSSDPRRWTLDARPPSSDAEPRTPNSESLVPAPSPQPPAPPVFRRDGEYWTIDYQEQLCRLREAKGLHYVQLLLRHPGREFHVLDLAALTEQKPEGAALQKPSQEELAAQALHVDDLRERGAELDAQARATYKQRLEDAQEELTEAERHHDLGRISALQTEMDFLLHELGSVYGVRRQAAQGTAARERVRQAVTKNIRASINKIAKAHAALGKHLRNAIKMGLFCSYHPETPTEWET